MLGPLCCLLRPSRGLLPLSSVLGAPRLFFKTDLLRAPSCLLRAPAHLLALALRLRALHFVSLVELFGALGGLLGAPRHLLEGQRLLNVPRVLGLPELLHLASCFHGAPRCLLRSLSEAKPLLPIGENRDPLYWGLDGHALAGRQLRLSRQRLRFPCPSGCFLPLVFLLNSGSQLQEQRSKGVSLGPCRAESPEQVQVLHRDPIARLVPLHPTDGFRSQANPACKRLLCPAEDALPERLQDSSARAHSLHPLHGHALSTNA